MSSSSPASGDGGAASGVGMDGATGSEAVVSVVRSAGARRARHSIRRQRAIGNVVLIRVPVQRSTLSGFFFLLELERRFQLEF